MSLAACDSCRLLPHTVQLCCSAPLLRLPEERHVLALGVLLNIEFLSRRSYCRSFKRLKKKKIWRHWDCLLAETTVHGGQNTGNRSCVFPRTNGASHLSQWLKQVCRAEKTTRCGRIRAPASWFLRLPPRQPIAGLMLLRLENPAPVIQRTHRSTNRNGKPLSQT